MNKNSIHEEFCRFYNHISTQNLDEINNLSKTKEIIAKYKGFDNWYQLERYFSIQDKHFAMYNHENIDIKFFFMNSGRIIYSKNEIKTYPKSLKNFQVKSHTSTPNIIGYDKEKKLLKSQNYYSINNYPFYIEGCAGSGTTEVSLTLAFQNIEKNEGVIVIDHRADNTIYYKIYSFCEQTNRLDDLYLLNCMSPLDFNNKSENDENNLLTKNINPRKNTHTIEPFNILINDKDNFETIFGKNTTTWLYPYLYNLQKKNLNISLDSLIDLFSFHTLLSMKNNDFGNQKEVTEYLSIIGLDETVTSEDELLAVMSKHFTYNSQALDVINKINRCSFLFSDTPDIDLEEIFLHRKILLILHPVLERATDEMVKFSLFLNNLIYVAEKASRKYNMHFQNIYSIDACYGLFYLQNPNELKETKNKYTFILNDNFQLPKYINTYLSPLKNNLYTVESFQSFLFLKSISSSFSKYIYYMYSNNPVYSKFERKISEQCPGEGHFIDTVSMNSIAINDKMSHNEEQTTFVYEKNPILKKCKHYIGDIDLVSIQCLYYLPKRTKIIRLIDHKKGE